MIKLSIQDADVVERCAMLIERQPDAMLLIPTETVYGLACLWGSAAGRDRIFRAKRREKDKPFQMLAPGIDMARRHGAMVEGIAARIAGRFFPGPLTLVVPSSELGTIGLRVPDHEFVLQLLNRLDSPLAATSANLSGEPPALSVDEAIESLAEPPNIVVDSGILPVNSIASTVVAVDANGLRILREGPIPRQDLMAACAG